MSIWLGSEWSRGYEKGREAGLAEERKENIDILLRHVCRDFMKTEDCPHGACEDIRNVVSLLRSKP